MGGSAVCGGGLGFDEIVNLENGKEVGYSNSLLAGVNIGISTPVETHILPTYTVILK